MEGRDKGKAEGERERERERERESVVDRILELDLSRRWVRLVKYLLFLSSHISLS